MGDKAGSTTRATSSPSTRFVLRSTASRLSTRTRAIVFRIGGLDVVRAHAELRARTHFERDLARFRAFQSMFESRALRIGHAGRRAPIDHGPRGSCPLRTNIAPSWAG